MKILVVDDHPVVREGIVALLRQGEPGVILLQAADVKQALAQLEDNEDVDVVVLDLVLPGMGGLPAIPEFGRARPELPVIILSSSEDARDARRAFDQGALGYVPKSATAQTLLAAIRLVLDGERYVPPLLLDEFTSLAQARAVARNVVPVLTDRQIEILQKLAEGRSNKLIAYDLDLSEKTVKGHITAIFKMLNVVNRTQAANIGREGGFIR